MPEPAQTRNLTLAITGASGSIYATELLRAVASDDRVAKINLVVSENALRVLAHIGLPQPPADQWQRD